MWRSQAQSSPRTDRTRVQSGVSILVDSLLKDPHVNKQRQHLKSRAAIRAAVRFTVGALARLIPKVSEEPLLLWSWRHTLM